MATFEGFPENTEGAADEARYLAEQAREVWADPRDPAYGETYQAANGVRVWVWSVTSDSVWYEHLTPKRDGTRRSGRRDRAWWYDHMTRVADGEAN